jgi:flagellin-like protein
MMNKQGVSPLIATVLLVMIVVSIGAAVMVVIGGLAQEGLDSTASMQSVINCYSDANLKLLSVDNKFRFCVNANSDNNTTIALSVENIGFKDILGMRVVVFGESNQSVTTYTSTAVQIPKGEIKGLRFNAAGVATNTSQIKKIVFNPIIQGQPGKDSVVCSLTNFEFDYEQLIYLDDCGSPTVTWDDNIPIITS